MSPHRLRPAARAAGFTLVELMVVVVIVGILTTVGIAAVRQYAFSSKASEALAMIQSIRAAEERYRAENLVYLNVSTAWYPVVPAGEEARKKRAFFMTSGHTDAANWRLLNPTVPGPVSFAYKVRAGAPAQNMVDLSAEAPSDFDPSWPEPPGKHWYVIEAIGNANGDADFSYFAATSLTADVLSWNEAE